MSDYLDKVRREISRSHELKVQANDEWYRLRSLLGNDWAMFYFLLGGREAGKSYAVTEFYVRQWRRYGRPFYWMRLTENSAKKLLMNNAEKLIDPDLRRRYKLDLTTNGTNVYEVLERDPDTNKIKKKALMARVLALNVFYNDKGSGLFDKDFLNDPKMYYNICLDEMNREQNERKSFDIVYSFANQLENIIRSTKQRVRVICVGNTLEEASDILSTFNFLPDKFGRYKLKSKRAIIDYIQPSEVYKKRRTGTAADILAGNSSTFTNEIDIDVSLVTKQRLIHPSYVICFNKSKMFTVWDGTIVAQFNGERVQRYPMRPYIDLQYNKEFVDAIISYFDTRSFKFHNLITQKQFKKELELLKPRK